MARLRRAREGRALERPYTRISKYREKSFIKKALNTKIIRFVMGNSNKTFTHTLFLKSKSGLQIRDNAIESARTTSNKVLETTLGLGSYFLRIRPYPHHVLRHHSLASGAGADRFSTGMAHAFGKPDVQTVQLKNKQILMEVKVDKQDIPVAKKALIRAKSKLPMACSIELIKNTTPA